MSGIQFWISRGGQRLQLPVNPSTLRCVSPFGFQDVEVVSLGEVTIIGDPLQREYSIESFFPRDYNPAYCEYSGFMSPNEFVHEIESLRRLRKPVRFTVTGTDINYVCTIRTFDYEIERGGSPGDIYYSMTLKWYEEPNIRKVEKKENKTSVKKPSRPAQSKPDKPKSRAVKSGDSLWKIAASVYGDGSKWRTIYDANKGTIGNNPDLIKPGQKLVIP